jgi:hypothetical protein
LKKITPFIFFGNYFYGICAVALSIEASIQQQTALNSFWYYVLIFTATSVYYTKAYLGVTTADVNNKRSVWYIQNKNLMIRSQLLLTILMIVAVFFLSLSVWKQVMQMPFTLFLLMLVFPCTAVLYYGIEFLQFKKHSLRSNGWLKPFVIGFVWAGSVNIYPILFHSLETHEPFGITFFGVLLFVKNFMFITVLCIMFDIKDYAADYNQQLKTFVVRVGLRKTIFYIILPLCTVGFGTFLTFAFIRQIPISRIILNGIPFILLITVAWSMYRRKSILYYLAIIDGLMLVKAICGIISFTLF